MYCDLPDLYGPFKDVMPGYVAYKRSLGCKYGNTILQRLKEIDRFFAEHGVTDVAVSEEIFELWSARRGDERRSNQWKRISALNCFCRYLTGRGFADVCTREYPRGAWERTFFPYIFTHDQIAALFAAAGDMWRKRRGDRDAATMAALISLYYGCGLRKCEALNLRMRDVNLDIGTVRIMEGKNGTSRIVAASGSVIRAMETYCGLFCVGIDDDSFVFQNSRGNRLGDHKLYAMYRDLLVAAGIPKRKSARGPRIHDLRHTFCVHALEQMDRRGLDLYASAPLLCAYLGHKTISETEYYLRLVEENFRDIEEKSRRYAPGLFPKEGDRNGK